MCRARAADDSYQKDFPWVGAQCMSEALGSLPGGLFSLVSACGKGRL